MKEKQLKPQQIKNNPRINRDTGKENPFTDELNQQKNTDSNQVADSYKMDDGSWFPIMANVNKKALIDNSQVPGSPYMGRDRGQGNGSPETGAGESHPQRNNETRDWNILWNKFNKDNMPIALSPMSKRDLEKIIEEQKQKKEEITMDTKSRKKVDFKKLAKKREDRRKSFYEIEEDYSAYGRYCSKCAGVWKELLGYDERKKLGIERESEVWRCPNCKEVTTAKGSISEQTDGFSAYNTFTNGPVTKDDAFSPVNKIEEDKDRTRR